jgi:hypothetical protein
VGAFVVAHPAARTARASIFIGTVNEAVER